ncbi:MAG: flagellar basal body-associated FliL family protein [Lachnospiraceae bacterium]|nr:flagellar basal body-associated FliL family protein [Lachnospiraceae bacterium]MCR5740803.1 flagellar basal body-associated FliL family protein [Lachnospiraceae bacterium]
MKKNLLTILILALVIVNLTLTVITMISVTGTNKKTAALVDTIATVLNLELVSDEEDEGPDISLADTEIYTIAEAMTIPLKVTEGGKQEYMVCKIALSINTKDDDYKTYSSETISSYEPYIKQSIEGVISSYDSAYLSNPENREEVKKEVLKAIQKWMDSKVVYDISISDVKFG